MKYKPLFMLLFCCSIIMSLSTKIKAQSQQPLNLETKPNKFFLKGAYLDAGIVFTKTSEGPGRFKGGGISLITQKNWKISGRIASMASESPQKPSNYFPYRSTSSGSGGILGGPVISINPPSLGSNGTKNECDQACKYYKAKSLLVGKIFNLPDTKKGRLSLEGGITFLKIDEAVDFIYTSGLGYTFSREEYSRIGGSARIGMEFPLSKYAGFSITLDGTFAKGERLFGVGIGLMGGVLRPHT